MWSRVQEASVFIILLATCVAGIAHGTAWFAVVGACALALSSLIERQYAGNRYGLSHRGVSDPVLALTSILNAAVFSAAAFAFGHLTRWLWGF
jgi:hypothetical protein